jgi:hypothetical protein
VTRFTPAHGGAGNSRCFLFREGNNPNFFLSFDKSDFIPTLDTVTVA